MALKEFPCRRGSTFVIGFRDRGGNLTGNEIVRAAIKPAGYNDSVPADTVPAAASFSAEFVQPGGGAADYWRLWLSPVQTLALAEDRYVSDIRIETVGGDVIQTDPVIVAVHNRVTA